MEISSLENAKYFVDFLDKSKAMSPVNVLKERSKLLNGFWVHKADVEN